MELVLALLIGVLFGIGVYLLFRRDLVRVLMGLSILSNCANLVIISTGKLTQGEAPIVGDAPENIHGLANLVDPLPQALILTAIVISFGITAFFLILAFRNVTTTGHTEVEGGS